MTINQATILGPPGTGKTTRLLGIVTDELNEGLKPEELVFVTFTKAAQKEAFDRITLKCGINPKRLPWVRTIHSSCFRLLGLRSTQVLKGQKWKAFSSYYNYELTTEKEAASIEDPIAEPVRKTKHDHLRSLIEWAASRCLTLDEAYCTYQDRDQVDLAEAHQFHHHLIEYKKKFNLYTFYDMIEHVITSDLHPPSAKVLVIDEAQDLSPLLIRVVEMWRTRVRYTYIAGDDDQAIFGFQGANPKWLGEQFRASAKHEVLQQSWRVPVDIHAMACSIIARNFDRVPKEYRPKKERGMVIVASAYDAFNVVPKDGSVFVLARNRRLLEGWIDRLFQEGEPYQGSLLSRQTIRESLDAAKHLRESGYILGEELLAILRYVPCGPLSPRGTKAKVRRLEPATRIGRMALCNEWDLADILNMAVEDPASLLIADIEDEGRDYIRRILDRYDGEVPEPRWILSTIHGVKGREADTVVLISDMLLPSYQELSGEYGREGVEAEHRVAYVAVTRAKKNLIIERPTGKYFFDYVAHID